MEPTTSNAWAQLAQLRGERDEARESAAATVTALDAALAQLKIVGGERDRAIACMTDISRERGELVLILRDCYRLIEMAEPNHEIVDRLMAALEAHMPWSDWVIALLVGLLVALTVSALWHRSDS